MSESVYTTAPVSERRLWYGATAAMIAWIVEGITSFVIADAACAGGRLAPWAGFSVGTLQAILIAISLIALAVSVSAGVVAQRIRRSLSDAQLHRDQASGRANFMAVAGVFMSIIFSIGILWFGLAPILSGLCEATR